MTAPRPNHPYTPLETSDGFPDETDQAFWDRVFCAAVSAGRGNTSTAQDVVTFADSVADKALTLRRKKARKAAKK